MPGIVCVCAGVRARVRVPNGRMHWMASMLECCQHDATMRACREQTRRGAAPGLHCPAQGGSRWT